MSRIGKKPIPLPKDVTVLAEGHAIRIKGPKGELSVALHPAVQVKVEQNEVPEVVVSVAHPDDKKERALWGLFRALIRNQVVGVTQGYEKRLEVNGVGYRVAQVGKGLKLEVGFSHPVEFVVPVGIEASVEKNVIILRGIDKQLVGEIASRLRKIKPPEPYKGKGIKYTDEVIRRKAGKAATKGAAA